MSRPRRTFVLVDGENIDATLGNSLLTAGPTPEERPRWERVMAYAEQLWGQPATGLFFLNATSGHLPTPFVQALLAMNYRPIPLSGRSDEKVVDIGIQRTLDALLDDRRRRAAVQPRRRLRPSGASAARVRAPGGLLGLASS